MTAHGAPDDHPGPWSGPVREFAFPVESGHVLAFERAIGQASGHPFAPLTFAAATDHFDPGFARRPPLGAGWGDSLPESNLHVEQHFSFTRPVRVGEQLTARRGAGRIWTKQGRSGRLRFVEERTELHDDEGAVVVMRWVDVHAERAHAELTNAQRAAGGDAAGSTAPPPPVTPPGEPVVLATDLSRTQLVMYAGASGDFHPLHHDEALAHRHGYPSVFCPGMLTMAISCRALATCIDTTTVRELSSRFRAQVWPGATLTAYVARGEEPDAPIRVVTVDQDGTVVLETTATVDAG